MNFLEVTHWLEKFKDFDISTEDDKEIVIAPSYPYLEQVFTSIKGTELTLGAQDVSTNTKGAHTGDVGAFQLKDFCKYCIVGHSERKESTDVVSQKIDLCVQNNITPIVCFVTPEQLKTYAVFNEVALFTWEDPNNISHGGVYNPKNIEEIETGISQLRSLVKKDTVIIYGGSVNRDNIGELARLQGLNGVLIGNASTDPKHFFDIIVEYCKQ
ncbi:hypothetical protein A2415_04245 [candidate division WWE3 bacterium RIFOXYC1_FULL_39_7]|uniref:Triosephosphate isomerase n=2 Tax=Katanobacteria TaxID=422282 RepID=A0A1F4X7H1_UNCKA|nr:MAG: hypothetical protein A2415_04245 [candidate division WWE3 bacterium RIFOXYC1_FULL_39_7]OGC77660.1 MAG: hypothetical protein A2619_05500 [candidate division WWE3 bacterium RIFOXYD1_FULL_39_9]